MRNNRMKAEEVLDFRVPGPEFNRQTAAVSSGIMAVVGGTFLTHPGEPIPTVGFDMPMCVRLSFVTARADGISVPRCLLATASGDRVSIARRAAQAAIRALQVLHDERHANLKSLVSLAERQAIHRNRMIAKAALRADPPSPRRGPG